ncbi:MAG: DUF805 domain-containing protein [Rhodobacteraceae bacterium CG17_big_fil_post_rev_8_21_14_2_50_63_15]|nr:DUF805 domain-containing protein [Roseovarius sp.]PIV79396.1 MAG: DUF805 domain-containing protein [Rhodobacteraceae bacterium CG17_big_fil_post_rev_8_21_14_2_50_63_15]
MDFGTAVKTCLIENYLTFSGRAARSEYWWFALFVFGTGAVLQLIGGDVLSGIFGLAVLLPGISVAVRRLHDLDRTGWWYMLVVVPLIGALVLIFFFFIHRGTVGANRFGLDPLAGRG